MLTVLLLTRWHMTFTAFWLYHPDADCRSQHYDKWASVCTVDTRIMGKLRCIEKSFRFSCPTCMSRHSVSTSHINRAVEAMKCRNLFSSLFCSLKIDQVWECVLIPRDVIIDQSINFHRQTFTELQRNLQRSRKTCRFSHRTWIFNLDQDKNRTAHLRAAQLN